MNPEINDPAAIYGVLTTMVCSKLRDMYPEGNQDTFWFFDCSCGASWARYEALGQLIELIGGAVDLQPAG